MPDIAELKQTERLFIAVRLGAVPTLLVLGWLHDPLPLGIAAALAGVLAVTCLVGWQANGRIKTTRPQRLLGAAMLAADSVVAITAISLFVADRSTAAYAGFALVVIQAGVRYAIPGSLAMAGVFAAGLAIAMLVRLARYEVAFSLSGYAFWTLFMAMLAVSVGLLVRQSRERQREVIRLSAEQARLEERQRLSRELHDSLLKTLHGLALEAHALQGVAAERPAVVEKASYIKEVCSKAAADIRELIFDLRNGDHGPFGHRASQIIERWRRRTGTAVDLHREGGDVQLPPRLHYDLRQTLEEALLNVERHARASQVTVVLLVEPSSMTVEISNDGAADAPRDGAHPGIGLVSMKERIEQWGGMLTFARDGGGAMLRLRIPRPFVASSRRT